MSSAKKNGVSGDQRDEGPLLGALLRLAHQAFVAELMEELTAAGSTDLRPAHFPITQALWDRPDGERLTELARAGRIKKQSAQALVDHLESHGYVERVADPSDQRARLVRLTPKGRRFGRTVRRLVRRVEDKWTRRLGAERVAAMRMTLRELLTDND